MKKKLVALLVVVMVLCALCVGACDTHSHEFVEVAAKNPTCTEKGNDLYYTCSGCDQLFDADKNPIDAIPEIAAKGHSYLEHTEVAASCTGSGNAKYYTCENCSKIFDANKSEIDAIPTITANGHSATHTAEKTASCTEAGNSEYWYCSVCQKYFSDEACTTEKTLAELTIGAKGHNLTKHDATNSTCFEQGHDLYYQCETCKEYFEDPDGFNGYDLEHFLKPLSKHSYVTYVSNNDGTHTASCTNAGCTHSDTTNCTYRWNDPVENVASYQCAYCGHEKATVKVSVSGSLLIDVDKASLEIDVSAFGENVTVKSVALGNNTVTELTQEDTKVTLATSALINGVAHGDSTATLSVVVGDSTEISVTLPVRVAHTISTVEELKALYTVTDHETYSNPTVGGTLNAEGDSIATVEWYVLTADINGQDRLGGNAEYGQDDESWYTSGRYVQGFIGVFDGQGHTIKNFKILGHGFFGHVGRGTIQNVNFDSIELADGDTCLIGKLVDSTISNVKISNITVGALGDNSGVLAYHQCFSTTFKNVDIDLSNITTAINVFTKENTTADDFDESSFENVAIKVKHDAGIKLFSGEALTAEIEGIIVSFVPFNVEKPAASTEEFYYTGSELTYTVAASDWYTVSGNVQTEVGTYTVTVSLLKNSGISWADDTTDDLTFTFEIKEFTSDMVAAAAATFVAKVDALGTPVYPRDIPAITAVLTDYNALHNLVKEDESVVAAKATLDGYKAEADKYTLLAAYTTTTINPLSGYDKYYFVFYSTTAEATFFYQNEGDWTGQSNLKLEPQGSLTIEVPATHVAHKIYLTGLPENGWTLMIYGTVDSSMGGGTEIVALSVNGTTDAEIEGKALKVLSVYVPANAQYLEGWGYMNNATLTTLAGYNNVYVYVYNPLDEDVSFFLQDDKNWAGICMTTLTAKTWTKVSIDLSQLPEGANVYVDVSYKPEADSTGWMISDFFGTASVVEPGTVQVALSVNGSTDAEIEGTSHTVLATDVKKKTVEDWGTDNGGYFISWGSMTKAQIETLAAFENVYFYIYNPNECEVQFYFQENKDWSNLDSTTLAAKAWTKVSIQQLVNLPEGATMVYVDVDHNNHENFVYEGWMISDFYGTAK